MSRTGKIARLPLQVREQINTRIQNGGKGQDIVAWLNSLKEVKAALSKHFDNPTINAGNFSEWKLGGYRDWEAQQFAVAESRRIVEEGKELGEAGQGALADKLGTWVVGQYIMATRKMREKLEDGDDAGAWKLLRELCHDLVALRRGDHGAEWIRLERQRLKLQKQKQESSRENLKEEIRKENPPPEALSDEEQEAEWRRIFGMRPETHSKYQSRNHFQPETPETEPPAEATESEPSVPSVPSIPSPEPPQKPASCSGSLSWPNKATPKAPTAWECVTGTATAHRGTCSRPATGWKRPRPWASAAPSWNCGHCSPAGTRKPGPLSTNRIELL